MNSRSQAVKKYNEKNVRRYVIGLNRKTDSDLIDYLDNCPSIAGAIKNALRLSIKAYGVIYNDTDSVKKGCDI